MKRKAYKMRKGFTFVEVLIAMTLIAIAFVPLMKMFTVAMENIHTAKVMTTSISVGRQYMEMVKNLNLPEDRMRQMTSPEFFPPLNEPPLDMNNTQWRVKRIIHKETDPLKVDIEVYEEGDTEPVFSVTTLFEDIF